MSLVSYLWVSSHVWMALGLVTPKLHSSNNGCEVGPLIIASDPERSSPCESVIWGWVFRFQLKEVLFLLSNDAEMRVSV